MTSPCDSTTQPTPKAPPIHRIRSCSHHSTHPYPTILTIIPHFLSPAASDSYVPPAGDGVLEALTHNITTTPAGDPIDAFFTAKKTFAARSVEDILTSLYQRETLKYDNLRQLDYEEAALKTRLHELEAWHTGMNPQMERVKIGLEHELHALAGETRREHVECWRDVTRLKTDLRDALREFGQEQRKTDLLNTAPSPPWKSRTSAGN